MVYYFIRQIIYLGTHQIPILAPIHLILGRYYKYRYIVYVSPRVACQVPTENNFIENVSMYLYIIYRKSFNSVQNYVYMGTLQ